MVYNSNKRQYSTMATLFTALAIVNSVAQAQDITDINQDEYYGEYYMVKKDYAFYKMTVTDNLFNGTQYIAFKAYAASSLSDPDIFISKENFYPTSPANAEWSCQEKGTDTCFVHPDDIYTGDIFYIGVTCLDDCRYGLKADFVEGWMTVDDARRTSFVASDNSTIMINYDVPKSGNGGNTEWYEIVIESVDNQSPIDLYLALDDQLSLSSMYPQHFMTDDGIAIKYTEQEDDWCTSCEVYIIVNVIKQGRYFVTVTSFGDYKEITSLVKNEIFVSEYSQECVEFDADSVNDDLRINIWHYGGEATGYIAIRDEPTGPDEWDNINFPIFYDYQQSVIITTEDKNRQDTVSSTFYTCFWGFTDSSININTEIGVFDGYFEAYNNVLNQLTIEADQYVYFNFTDSSFIDSTTVTVTITMMHEDGVNLPSTPEMYYMVCQTSKKCVMTEDEATKQSGTNSTKIGTLKGDTVSGTFTHDPANCDYEQCVYMISLVNKDNDYLNATFKVTSDVNYQNNLAYYSIQEPKVPVNMSEYIHYKIDNTLYQYSSSVEAVVINLESYFGDADLFVSLQDDYPTKTVYDYQSRSLQSSDQIILNSTAWANLNTPIYISVYGHTMAHYSLFAYPIIGPSYQNRLDQFSYVQTGVLLPGEFNQEFVEEQYRYYPYWSRAEERTLVFWGKELYNQIKFYSAWNDYPKTSQSPQSNGAQVIVYYESDEDYFTHGNYYIRLMPDFSLASLISLSKYEYEFTPITVKPMGDHQDIQLSQEMWGYANYATNYYRHFIIDNDDDATYKITVDPYQGNPNLYVQVGSFTKTPSSYQYDYKSDHSGTHVESVTITKDNRLLNDNLCQVYDRSLQGDGSFGCAFFVGVMCPDTECVYKITVELNDINAVDFQSNSVIPPSFVAVNEWYDNELTEDGDIQYFYMPVSYEKRGEALILINKTQNFNTSIDSGLIRTFLNVQPDLNGNKAQYTSWEYPTSGNNKQYMSSYTQSTISPEIFQLSADNIQDECHSSDNSNEDTACALLWGVESMNSDPVAFRTRVFWGIDKLNIAEPRQDIIGDIGDYHYYWFFADQPKNSPGSYWQMQIGLAINNEGGDADLFVSVMDGRDPVSQDYDFKSDFRGADFVHIESNCSFFEDSQWDQSAGVTVVIGVKAITDNVNYTLVQYSQDATFSPITVLDNQDQRTIYIKGSSNTQATDTQYFMWYNYGSLSYQFQLYSNSGNLKAYLSSYEERPTQYDNAFVSIPVNETNSFWNIDVDEENEFYTHSVYRYDVSLYDQDYANGISSFNTEKMCYNCWVLATVYGEFTDLLQYSVMFQQQNDVGNQISDLVVGGTNSISIASNSEKQYLKMIFTNKGDVRFDFDFTYGSIDCKVSLNPYDFSDDNVIWSYTGASDYFMIKTDDPDFMIGTYYYIEFTSLLNSALFDVSLSQNIKSQMLISGVEYKFEFSNPNEDLQFYNFLVPEGGFNVIIDVKQITEDFYPQLYLRKNEVLIDDEDELYGLLVYPTIYIHDYAFGQNFTAHMYSEEFSYSFSNSADTDKLTYYTMAVFGSTWGMSGNHKQEYLITVTVSDISLSDSHSQVLGAPVVEHQKIKDVLIEPQRVFENVDLHKWNQN